MRIGIWLSSLGGSPLVGGLERGLESLGHYVEPYRRGAGYDLVIVANQTAHTLAYRYPEFPDPSEPIAFVDSAEYGYFKRFEHVARDYANAFSAGSMAHDTKRRDEQERLQGFLEGRSFPYFLREFSRYIEFPAGYHPIDYPLYHLSVEERRPDREEYLRRPLDLFVSWGASHPWRMNLTGEMREWATAARRDAEEQSSQRAAEIHIIEEVVEGRPTPRMEQGEFFERTRSARCSVSFDGYGSGSFRMTEALVRTVLVQGPLTMRTRAPLKHWETCVEFAVASSGEKFLKSNIGETLDSVLRDPVAAYEVYERGFDHCMTHLTERATAEYLLSVVEGHDWNRPTELHL